MNIDDSKLGEYTFRRIIDDDKNLSIHGRTLIETYSKVAKLPSISLSYKKTKPIVIDGAKIFNELNHYSKNNAHLIMKVRDILRINNLPSSFNFSIIGYKSIIKSWQKNDERYLRKYLNYLEKVFTKINPSWCVVNSTIDPTSRLMVLASKRLGISTACVQHGVYSELSPVNILDEDLVDIFFTLDEKQKKILSRAIPNHKMVSLGEPSSFYWKGSPNISVCLVGTDLERYGWTDKKQLIEKTYIKLSKQLKKNNYYNFFYKPHPSEKVSLEIKSNFEIINSITNTNIDVFIGFNSTLLKDTSSIGKPSIQILENNISAVNYEEYSYCKTFSFKDNFYRLISEILKNGGSFPQIKTISLEEAFKNNGLIIK